MVLAADRVQLLEDTVVAALHIDPDGRGFLLQQGVVLLQKIRAQRRQVADLLIGFCHLHDLAHGIGCIFHCFIGDLALVALVKFYGIVRLAECLYLTALKEVPQILVGFLEITVIALCVFQCGIERIGGRRCDERSVFISASPASAVLLPGRYGSEW